MSKILPNEAFKSAVDLVINQDRVIEHWTARYVAIESGAAVAVAALLSLGGPPLGVVAVALVTLIAVVAMILTWAITEIVKRELAWQANFVGMVLRTEGDSPFLFQPPGQYTPLAGRSLSSTFEVIRPVIVWMWSIFILSIWVVAWASWFRTP